MAEKRGVEMTVREQARTAARHIRTDVQGRRDRELGLLAQELRQDWEQQQSQKISALRRARLGGGGPAGGGEPAEGGAALQRSPEGADHPEAPRAAGAQPSIEASRPHVGRSVDISVFSSTHHHRLEPIVDRELPAAQADAHEEAQKEVQRLQEWREEEARRREEQRDKARLRGRSALRREQLTQASTGPGH
ncbi:hypothetical protein CRUP_036497 [Coryphaenoides rupestris]|nr:hypothetical protein CRUP_036497 [Coryphaenoides rupestris]